MRAKSRGVALVLVLMIVSVLGLLTLQIGLTAKEHTARAQRLIDRASADFSLRSAQANFALAMVTTDWVSSATAPVTNEYASAWRFDGTPFSVGAATYEVQDLSGLMPMPQPGGAVNEFEALLRAIDVEANRAKTISSNLSKSQAPPESVPLQDFTELRVLGDLSAGELAKVRAAATLFPSRAFNPGNAPALTLAVRFSGSTLEGIQALRSSGRLNETTYYSVTGLGGDETVSFYPGPGFRIAIRVSSGLAKASEELTLTIDPYSDQPFILWARKSPAPEYLGR
jgi:hypothetical protein